MIRIGTLDWGEEERKAVEDLISQEDPILTLGPITKKFETEFAKWVDSKYAIFVNSGTSALITALKAAKTLYSRKLEINAALTTTITYPATWNAILATHMSPICLGVNPNKLTVNMHLMTHFTEKFTIYLPVHLFGIPAFDEPDDISMIEYKGIIIEDSCQAIGSKFYGHYLGTIGLAGCYSFYPAHTICTIEGGMIVTDNSKFARICRSIRDNGRMCVCPKCKSKQTGICPKIKNNQYDVRWIYQYAGYNFKPTEIQSAIGLVKMKKINKICERRKEIMKMYMEEIPSKYMSIEDEGIEIVPMAYPIQVPKNKSMKFVSFLYKYGIEARGMFIANDPVSTASKEISQSSIYLPCHQNLTDEDVKYIIEKMKEAYEKYE